MPMTPYKPTVRDNTARRALELLGDTYANRKLVRNIFGSSGIGSTGEASLVDFTPIGVGFAADEAGRQAGQGHPWAAAGNLALAALPIPGKAIVRGAARAVAGKAKGMMGKAMQAAPSPGITAYHGSPHTFNQFSADKIGTGEGAQAYGHGLYFAENEGVAKNYRDTLSNRTNLSQDQLQTTLNGHQKRLDDLAQERLRVAPLVARGDLFPAALTNLDSDIFRARAAVDATKQSLGGSMYQVRINADPNDFLDWDAPLSGQSEKVQGGVNAVSRFTQRERETLPIRSALEVMGTPGETSAKLAQAGIPGIKYLDQGSRTFTPPTVKDGPNGAELYWGNDPKPVGTFPTRQAAEEAAKQLDTRSRNFVVFDPRIIDIMKRYGVAAPVAAAILAGTMPRPAEAREQSNLFGQPQR